MMNPVAEVERWLADLVPRFLANRLKDVDRLRAAMENGDFASISFLAHNLKGAASGYGFLPLAELGVRLETAAWRGDAGEIGECAGALEAYVRSVRVVYR